MRAKNNSKKQSDSKKAGSNRQNSLQSTGPKSPLGKKKASLNAMKHGLLSKEVFIKSGDGRESKAEFNRLWEEVYQDLQPVGALEELLFDMIFACRWRHRRLVRCEMGEIRSKLDNAQHRERSCQMRKFKFRLQLARALEEKEEFQQSSMGVRYLLSLLSRAETELEKSGKISEKTHERLLKCLEVSESELTKLLARHDPSSEHETEEGESDGDKWQLLEAIDYERNFLENLLETLKKNEAMEIEAKIMSLNLPDKETVDKLLRYETTIERQLYRAMDKFEIVQLRRMIKGS